MDVNRTQDQGEVIQQPLTLRSWVGDSARATLRYVTASLLRGLAVAALRKPA